MQIKQQSDIWKPGQMRKIAFIKYACNASLWDVSYIFVLSIVGDILVCHSPKICIKSSSESGWQINLLEYEMVKKKNFAPPQKQKDCRLRKLLTIKSVNPILENLHLGQGL